MEKLYPDTDLGTLAPQDLSSDEVALVRLYRENRCGDADCEGRRFSAAQSVLKGATTHDEVARMVSEGMYAASLAGVGDAVFQTREVPEVLDGAGEGGPGSGSHADVDEGRAVAAPEPVAAEQTVTELRTACATLAQELRWQPIATAPKQGTAIIGALIQDGKVRRVHDMQHNGLAFYTINGLSLPQMTHWLPLPDPPKQEGANE